MRKPGVSGTGLIRAAYRITGRCYGMTGQFRSACGQPHLSNAPKSAGALSYRSLAMLSPRHSLVAALVALSCVTLSGAALASPVPLAQEAHINDELRAAAAGDILRHTCPTLSARVFVFIGRVQDLENYARSKGYAEPEVKAFLDDDVQKARVKAEAQAYLAQAGAKSGDVESYCKVGRDEIAKKTPMGQMLRSSK